MTKLKTPNKQLAFIWPILILCFIVFGQSRLAQANEFKGVRKNNKGVTLFGQQRPAEAYDRFTDALVDLPDSPVVHFNIGTSFLVNKEYDKALSEYDQVLRRTSRPQSSSAREIRFRALFNSAVALTELKRVDEALEFYQEALEVKPDSLETKTNIELLTRGGGGGGGGDNQKKQDQGDKKNDQNGQGNDKKDDQKQDSKSDQKDQKQPQQFKNGDKQKSQPKPFKSEELSQQDVNRILEELKRQEEQVRAKMQNEGAKDAPPDKDW